ncbi:Holliday junction branch migration protein RuvA [Flavobacteriales bacterium]|jgi:Holliday junction DNA helicase RuvA|nr:Holliday junction branch migration protein RuvA [Flavobacteriales bacterium]MDB4195985.1 Holliday junction branch migration protein RuvA [Flavobacteriales bacterium]MDC1352852.1 Holliday junction branch migration protein RuvA [Flavobacteriales bacterium]MDG1175154.1 Holliday junction branch migration protein RuvA [Flavobacteriales bacterium]|tara:strand:+ start:13448 stop:14035 length:588 start_codon:yes stop_codon:yes gene_type:complete
MITYVSGKLVEKNPSYVVIETGGIGYFIHISLQTYSQLGNNENCKLFTYFSVKEDSQTLYGFKDTTERELFKQLISVSGVGTNTARMMLSSMTSSELVSSIASSNVTSITSIKGIGAKTAQRIILDLKDKILKTTDADSNNSALINNTIKNEALSALVVLGFDKKAAEKAIDTILLKEPSITDLEVLIKKSLKSF